MLEGAGARTIAYRLGVAIVAAALLGATALAGTDPRGSLLGQFVGERMLRTHALVWTLGAETSTSPGAYTGAVGWLGALTTNLLARAGPAVSIFATMLAAAVAFVCVERRARDGSSRPPALAAVALAGLCAVGSLGVAGGIVTAAYAAALAYVLGRPSPRSALLATLVALVWCNAAPQGLLAPLIAAALVPATTFDARSTRYDRRWARLALLGTMLATLATPALFSYPVLAFADLRLDPTLAGPAPFAPAMVAPFAYRAGFLSLAFLAFALGSPRGRAGSIPLLLFTALLALANGAYIVVFGVLAAPVLAASAARAFPKLARTGGDFRREDRTVLGCVALAAVFAAWVAGRHATALPGGYGLAVVVAADGRPHRIFCADVDWCDAALSFSPRVRVFMDGRVAAYPDAVRTSMSDIDGARASWDERLSGAADAIVVPRERELSGLLALSPDWRLVASDDVAAAYERTGVAR